MGGFSGHRTRKWTIRDWQTWPNCVLPWKRMVFQSSHFVLLSPHVRKSQHSCEPHPDSGSWKPPMVHQVSKAIPWIHHQQFPSGNRAHSWLQKNASVCQRFSHLIPFPLWFSPPAMFDCQLVHCICSTYHSISTILPHFPLKSRVNPH